MEVIDWLKNTYHVQLVFERPSDERNFLRGFLHWLNGRSVAPVSDAAVNAHMQEIEARQAGGRSIPDVAAKNRQMVAVVRAVSPLLKYYSFATYDLGYTGVSVDLFNPAEELGIPRSDDFIVEVFQVLGKGDSTGSGLRRFLKEVVSDFQPKHAFGGYPSFTARYVNSIRAGDKRQPSDFLWPLTFLPGITSTSARVHAAEVVPGGLIVQVFPDLANGSEEQYRDAARALNLTSLWEVPKLSTTPAS